MLQGGPQSILVSLTWPQRMVVVVMVHVQCVCSLGCGKRYGRKGVPAR